MSDPTNQPLPPLGEPTPGPAVPSGRSWRRRTAAIATGTLLVGLVAGFALAQVVAVDDGGEDSTGDGFAVQTTLPRTTTTQGITLPPECRDAIRSAEQAVALLEQGFQSLRTFAVADLDRVLAELQRLQAALSGRVRECLEQA